MFPITWPAVCIIQHSGFWLCSQVKRYTKAPDFNVIYSLSNLCDIFVIIVSLLSYFVGQYLIQMARLATSSQGDVNCSQYSTAENTIRKVTTLLLHQLLIQHLISIPGWRLYICGFAFIFAKTWQHYAVSLINIFIRTSKCCRLSLYLLCRLLPSYNLFEF